MRQQWADYRVFLQEFRRTFTSTGSIVPSGSALGAALASYVRDGDRVDESLRSEIRHSDDSNPALSEKRPYRGRRILEAGPGTGAVTRHIVHAMREDDELVLVERNDVFVDRLRDRLANDDALRPLAERITLCHGSLEELPDRGQFDVIVSGLPFNNFPIELVDRIFDKFRGLLTPDGTLSFFEYIAVRPVKSLIGSRVNRENLQAIGRRFDELFAKHEIRRDRVLANFPPAWVHHVRGGDWGLGTRG